jgi:hypothetical protein
MTIIITVMMTTSRVVFRNKEIWDKLCGNWEASKKKVMFLSKYSVSYTIYPGFLDSGELRFAVHYFLGD